MSEVAGRMSIQAAAYHLEKRQHGKGVLMAGIPGVDSAQVLILGAGIVGKNALQMAIGMGAQVTIVDKNMDRLRDLDLIYGNRIQTAYADQAAIERLFPQVDVVIGGVLIPGGTAPQLLKREHLGVMQDGAVIVDVAIDQGGCFETSHATTHDEPTFIVDGIVHYCVANMPGAVPRTATLGLTNATFPYISSIANFGLRQVVQGNDALRRGVTSHQGYLTCNAVAKSQRRQCMAIEDLIH
jgi:alanine dehydrogenase